ncbi:dehydrodolichyl diphosphate synthase CPT3-like isoform X1 [Juglans microcarpa x Juglans regia]|uniref:dehydrodolichyl diphosphate synthase CPT3-like isoform X1 n=3 Tax=Juglans microcarpa x Juglans regia TaxID=2249226 RepID=UPI001B7F3854|nr:dehydrodolichyl diphosphate synthase CPT3-like isoform X1 [Juglans microcarpa x Juglans regia]XP_041004630.1 dehydrodolichyl diphosphate synthase CPT3-like isoform X1 [Juglans microcarpa x Juglans regia]
MWSLSVAHSHSSCISALPTSPAPTVSIQYPRVLLVLRFSIYTRFLRMEKGGRSRINCIFENLVTFLRRCIFYVLSVGPFPYHIAFIMDGNRRYAKKQNFMEGNGHSVGFLALLSMLKYCYELGVKYVTIYAFSIDNFKRQPEEVQSLMDLMQLKIEGLIKEESIANCYGVRVHFIGNLKLLSEPVRLAAERAMLATANNSKAVLSVCVAYTSTNEIVRAVQKSCEQKWEEISILDASGSGYGLTEVVLSEKDEGENLINLIDIEKHMYMAVAPDPDILIRTSGETRLSNFLLWQTAYCSLYSPYVLWPEIGFRHFLWAILNFQQNHFYLEKRRKQL